MLAGGMPRPVHAPPTVQLDDVTKGYVPGEKNIGLAMAATPLTGVFVLILLWLDQTSTYQSQCQVEQRWPLQLECSLETREVPRACNRLHLSPLAATSQRIPARHQGRQQRLVSFITRQRPPVVARLVPTLSFFSWSSASTFSAGYMD